MFTGIIIDKGRVLSLERRGGDATLAVVPARALLERLAVGDSISVQGACLTVTTLRDGKFFADLSNETLAKTTLGKLHVGSAVNLEPALRAGDALGGHLVSGHVDGVAHLTRTDEDARSRRLRFRAPPELARFIAAKGSACLDGVSLTVNEVHGDEFDVNIIPHTYTATTLGERRIGDGVNLEIDLIARYLDRLLTAGEHSRSRSTGAPTAPEQ